MADIVERLRDLAKYRPVDMGADDCREAADEIERLREEVLKAAEMIFLAKYSPVEARADALEEAALAVEAQRIRFADRVKIAAVIRALKQEVEEAQ